MSDYQAIETALTEHITGPSLNRAVGGWEEYGFETGVAKANNPDYWVNSWHYHTQVSAPVACVGVGLRGVAWTAVRVTLFGVDNQCLLCD